MYMKCIFESSNASVLLNTEVKKRVDFETEMCFTLFGVVHALKSPYLELLPTSRLQGRFSWCTLWSSAPSHGCLCCTCAHSVFCGNQEQRRWW